MKLFPCVSLKSYIELKPGAFVLIADYDTSYFAIKTAEESALILGPNFGHLVPEPMVIDINTATCLSYGEDLTIRLPDKPGTWTRTN